jgi:hypothetical protein
VTICGLLSGSTSSFKRNRTGLKQINGVFEFNNMYRALHGKKGLSDYLQTSVVEPETE